MSIRVLAVRILAPLLPMTITGTLLAEEVSVPPLVARAELRELSRAAPWKCYDYDPATRTCAAIGQTSWSDQGSGRSDLLAMASDKPDLMVLMSMPVRIDGDVDCVRASEVTVEFVSSSPVPAPLERSLRARFTRGLTKMRPVSCSGMMREGDHFRVITSDGDEIGRQSLRVHLMPQKPKLRPMQPATSSEGRIMPLGATGP